MPSSRRSQIGRCFCCSGERHGQKLGRVHSLVDKVYSRKNLSAPQVGRMHFVGATTSDLYDVNIYGPSGIMKTAGRRPLPRWIPSKRRIELPNGATCVCGRTGKPGAGPNVFLCCIDELGRMREQQAVFDNAGFGLRLGPALDCSASRDATSTKERAPLSASMGYSPPPRLALCLEPDLDQPANGFGTRRMVILGFCPKVQFSQRHRL
jgi:hypothetical protein